MSPRSACSGLLALLVAVVSAGYPPDTSQVADSLGYHLPRSLLVGATARLVAHADLNGDGKEDLILAGQSQRLQERGVEILEGNGDGTFRKGVTIDLQNPSRAMVVADVNGDGKPDLILLHPGIGILLNTTPYPGAPVSFGLEQSLVGGFGPALAASDLNGDGKAEVLLGTMPTRDASDEQGTLRIAAAPVFVDANHHSGSAPAIDIPIPGVPVSIAVADFDGDGKPDVAVGFTGPLHEPRGGVAVLLNRTESPTTPIHFADPVLVQFDHPVDFVAAADLNGDGRNDVFAAWCSGRDVPCGTVSLLNRPSPDGGIGFATQSTTLAVRRASNWILQDINHDGKPDLLFLSRQQGVTFPVQAPGEIVVAFGLGDGRFAAPRAFSAPTADSLGMVLADFNRDGLFDLAILDAASLEVPKISLLLGRKDYGFSAPESLISGFVPTALIPFSDHGKTTGFIVTNTAAGPASSSKAAHTAKIFNAKSLSAPYSPLSTVTGISDGAIAVGDLNADGRTELVLVTSSDIQVYSLEDKVRNHPVQAAKVSQASNRFAAAPQRAILQDLNGDGKPDLIVGNGYDPSLEIYLNTSAGTFSFAPPVSVPWCPKGSPPIVMKGLVSLSIELAAADINGDGKPDLVASGHCGLNVMLNRTPAGGSIAFDPPVPVSDPKQQSPWQSGIFALADVNRDGKADVIVVENSYTSAGETSALNVFVNETTASPTFRLAQHVPAGKRLTGVGAGDFNQDGWPDIATIDADGTLTFLLNDRQWKAKGAFMVHSSFTVMPNPQQLLVIDRPGGGTPRLLLRNQDSAAIVQ
ncbi:MAG: VCBS repeat-containing protein [Terriglobales bacterium]|jgi:hypothetical protein